MLTLGETNSLQGSAASASKVAYSLVGAHVGSNTNYKVLAQGLLGETVGTLYEVAANESLLISHILLSNTDESAQVVQLYLNGDETEHRIVRLTIPALGSATFDGTGWKVYDSEGNLASSITSLLVNSGKGHVNHGKDAAKERPSGFASIEWHGSVEPENAVENDTWIVI